MAIEVTAVKGSPIFPRAYRATKNKHVVLFVSEMEGVVLSRGDVPLNVGEYRKGWVSCYDSARREPVNLTITHD